MKVKLILSAIFAGVALMAADSAESLVFKQDFESGADQFVKAPETAKYYAKVKPEVVEGRAAGSKAVRFGDKMDCMIRGMKMPIPGNASLWVKTDEKITKNGIYRRFFATSYSGKGYFGFQEYATYSLLFLHNFNKKNKNIGSKPLPVGTWNHISLNFQEKFVEIYVNGVKVTSSDLPESIAGVVGEIVYGSKGTSVDSVEIYNRVLTEDEIKALAK